MSTPCFHSNTDFVMGINQVITKNLWQFGIKPETKIPFQQNDIFLYIKKVHDVIYEAFKTIKSVEVDLVEDPEIPSYPKIRFDITLSGEPSQIIKSEDRFDLLFYKSISEEKQPFFTFTYRVENEPS